MYLKGMSREAGEKEGNETNNIMIIALIYCVKIITAVKVFRHLHKFVFLLCIKHEKTNRNYGKSKRFKD